MRSASRAGTSLLTLIALHACATPPRRDLVWISVGGDQACIVGIDDRRFALPADRARLRSAMKRIARRAEGAVIGEVDGGTPFECWSAAILALKGVGFRRLGLISDHADVEDQ